MSLFFEISFFIYLAVAAAYVHFSMWEKVPKGNIIIIGVGFFLVLGLASSKYKDKLEMFGAYEPQYSYQWKGPALFRAWMEYGEEKKEMCIPSTKFVDTAVTKQGRNKRKGYYEYACEWTRKFKEPVN